MASHLPHFIEDTLVHSCNLNTTRKQRSTLALVRNLHFYEVHNKQILNSIDLQNTILGKAQYKFDFIESETTEKINGQTDNIIANSKTYSNHRTGDIVIGKFVFQNRTDRIFYVLIQCWNSMVVVKRDLQGGFLLQDEFEDVQSFEMLKDVNYQEKLSIKFLGNIDNKITNFQENCPNIPSINLSNEDVYRKMIDKINMQKSELLVHQINSRKEFYKLKSTQVFGDNILRTPRLEELQILSKCGNSWIKLTRNDDVVIGVPVVNNCSSRLTILRNFHAVLQGVGDSIQSFKLYQFNKSLSDTDNVESLFDDSEYESDDKCATNGSWRQCYDVSLRPEALCVLILKLKIQDLHFESEALSAPLFVFYDIYTSNKTFRQQCFLTAIIVRDLFKNDSFNLSFDEKNLYRDFLTVIASSYETEFKLDYAVSGTAFENFLCQKLDFYRISENQSPQPMDVEDQDEHEKILKHTTKKIMFYNKNQNSFWHGTLIEILHLNNSSANIRLFTKSQEKSKIFLKQIQLDIKAEWGVIDLKENFKSESAKLIDIENVLRDECSSCLEAYDNRATKEGSIDRHNQLYFKQLKTDLLFKELLS